MDSTNFDTTEAHLTIEYGAYGRASNWSNYTFALDVRNCKWNVKDSTFDQY
jgi:hypothetical protein